MREGAKRSRCRGDGGWWPGCRTVGACLAVCACACLCVSAWAPGRMWAWGAPTIAARYPLPPNPYAPAVSVPVPVPVPVPPRTPLRLPTVNTPLPQVNCAALWKAIHTTSVRSPSRPTGTTSCPDRMTRRSGSGTPHRVCLHIRRRAYVACPVLVSVSRECTSPLGPAQRCCTVGACLFLSAFGHRGGGGRGARQPSPNTTRSPPTPAPPRCLSLSLSLSLSPRTPVHLPARRGGYLSNLNRQGRVPNKFE